MAENFSQNDSGGLVIVNPNDSIRDLHVGGPVPSSTVARYMAPRIAVLALTAADTAGGIVSWNPGGAMVITNVVLHVKTVATGACTIDIGVAANGTTLNDTLLDGIDVHTATGLFDTATNKGSNGLTSKIVTATQYITASKETGAAAGLVGFLYVHYYPTF